MKKNQRIQYMILNLKKFDNDETSTFQSMPIFIVYFTESQEPDEQEFIITNSSCINLQLSLWSDGGCPISHFSIEHRPHG